MGVPAQIARTTGSFMKMTQTPRSFTRRSFLTTTASGTSVLLANKLFGAPTDTTTKPNPELEKLGAVALAEAKKQGATYADIRINRYRQQFSGYRLSPQRGATRPTRFPSSPISRASASACGSLPRGSGDSRRRRG